MSTMRDVANRAGVSAKTVSRVMNNDRYVSDDVRARVLRAVEDLQYVPNAMAKTFRTGQETAIGIAVPTLNHFFGQVVQAVEQIARARGAAMYLTCLGDDPDAEQAALETLLSRHMVGLIVAPIAADQSDHKPGRNHTAMVFIDRRPRKLAAASVVHDDIGGAAAAITHLVEHGHRRIAFAGDSLSVPTTARRRHGYETTLFDAGIAVDPFLVSFGADATPVIPRLLALPDPPTAIFSANPGCSVPIVRQLHAARRTDIPVISFGDFPLADTLTPPITVIDQDPLDLGTFAANRLFQRIDNPDKRLPRQTIVPVTLVTRGCCQRTRASPAA
jgi:LacI family transcriptional regulator